MSQYLNTLKQLGFKDSSLQQKGKGRVSSLSSISRQLFKTHYDGYHPRMSRHLATALKRYINTKPKHEKRTAEFVGEIRRKLLCLHEYNLQIAKVKFKYPRSEQLDAVLIQYIELESELLYNSNKEIDEQHENNVKQRVLRLLKVILHDALQNSEVSLKTTIKACDKALLKLFANVRADCTTENKLVANVIIKLLDKLSLLEEVNQLKGKNIPFYQDTFLRDPLVSKIRQNLATSDYESDIDSNSDEDIDDVPVINDHIFNCSSSRSFEPRSLFRNAIDREICKTKNEVIKVSQPLRKYELPQIKCGEEEKVFSHSLDTNNQQPTSNTFCHSNINYKRSYGMVTDIQYGRSSKNCASRNLIDENSSQEAIVCSSIQKTTNNKIAQNDVNKTDCEGKAVKPLSALKQAQKISSNYEECENFPKTSNSSSCFIEEDSCCSVLKSGLSSSKIFTTKILEENQQNLFLGTRTGVNATQNSSNFINDEYESKTVLETVPPEEASVTNRTDREEIDFPNELHNEVLLINSELNQISEINKNCSTINSQSPKGRIEIDDEVTNIHNSLSNRTTDISSIVDVSEHIEVVKEAVSQDLEATEILNSVTVGDETTKLNEDHLDSTLKTTENINLNLVGNENTYFHKHKPNSTLEVPNIETPSTTAVVDHNANNPQSADVTIDVDLLPDTVSDFRSTKMSINESISNGLITIEILDDDDDDEADYTFINHKQKGGQSEFILNNMPTNVLQNNEIKLEENEENHSPNFSVENSDSNSQNFLDSSNKDSRNSDSTGLNKLKNNSGNDSVKELEGLEIIISDSEDEILDMPEKDLELVDKSDSISTETPQTIVKTKCSTTFKEELHSEPDPTAFRNEVIQVEHQQNNNEEQIMENETNVNDIVGKDVQINYISEEQTTEDASSAVPILDNSNIEFGNKTYVEEICDNNVFELPHTVDLENTITSHNIPTEIHFEKTDGVEIHSTGSTENSENNIVPDQCSNNVERELTPIFEEQRMQTLEVFSSIEPTEDFEKSCSTSGNLPQNQISNDEIVSISSVEHHEEIIEEVVTTTTCEVTRYEEQNSILPSASVSEQDHKLVMPELSDTHFHQGSEHESSDPTVTEEIEATIESTNEHQCNKPLTTEETSVEPVSEETELCNTKAVIDHQNDQRTVPEIETEHTEILNTKTAVEFVNEEQYREFEGTEVSEMIIESVCEHQTSELIIAEVSETTIESVSEHQTYTVIEHQINEPAVTVTFEATYNEPPTNEVPVVCDNGNCIRMSASVTEQQSNFTEEAVTYQSLEQTVENETSEKVENTFEVVDYSTTMPYATENFNNETSNNGFSKEENGVPQVYDNVNIHDEVIHEGPSANLPEDSENQSIKGASAEILQNTVNFEVLHEENAHTEVEIKNTTANESFYYKSNISSTLNEVEYVEYAAEKKVNGDLELLANIAADQETLAVKTDSEKEVADTSSDVENNLNIIDISHNTPKRRKSKVRLDYKKKILARETLPRAVKQFQRKHPVKQKTNNEDLENTRITRNRANKPKIDLVVPKEIPKHQKTSRDVDAKYKPHDFISMENPTLPPPTNNVYAQKRLMEANTTSEDSNDSCESTLFIDLSENGKNAEKTMKSIYEEETINDMLEFVTTEEKPAVCISIPENEENCISESFQILKQMEDFVDDTSRKDLIHEDVPKTDQNVAEHLHQFPDADKKIEDVQPVITDVCKTDEYVTNNMTAENSTIQQNNEEKIEMKIVKTTDHSIENILNKIPLNIEVKVGALDYSNENVSDKNDTDESVDHKSEVSQNKKTENEIVVVNEELVLNSNEKVQEKETFQKGTDDIPNDKILVQTPLESDKLEQNIEVQKPLISIADNNEHKIEQNEQMQSENLTINQNNLTAVRNDEYCEKTFKTKAAMKSYEDKLQPYVLLTNCAKSKFPKNEFGILTRSRSKSSEHIFQDNSSNRNRSSSVDSVPASLNTEIETSPEFKKSNQIYVEKTGDISTNILVDSNTNEKNIEPPINLTSGVENMQKSNNESLNLLQPEIAVRVVSTCSESVVYEIPLSKCEIPIVEFEKEKPDLLNENPQHMEENKQLPNDENVVIEQNELKTSVPEEEKIASQAAEETIFPVPDSLKDVPPSNNFETEQATKLQEENTCDEKVASKEEEEPVIGTSPVIIKSIEKSTSDRSKFDEEKGRSLENTIKKMKEKIVESEKAKKEQVTSKPTTETKNLEFPPKKDELQVSQDKSDTDKKQDKLPTKSGHSEDVKEKSNEGSKKDSGSHKKRRSRSSSKSRTSSKKHDQSVDKEKTNPKESPNRSSSKSRSVDKYHKHHSDGESDKKQRSNSRPVEEKDKKIRTGELEEVNGHDKRRSRSSSKSKSLERKSKHNSSDKCSSKHRSSDTKEKQTNDDGKDHHKKRSSKSPSKSKSSEVKGRQSHSDKRSDTDKGKVKDKTEDVKSKSNQSKVENRSRTKTEAKSPPQSKDKLNNDNVEKQNKENDEKILKISSTKSYKIKSKQQCKSRDSNTIKSLGHNEKNDEKINDKDKHRDNHKTKSKETQPKSGQEKHNTNTEKQNDDHVKDEKPSRSHSKEKTKSESSSRSEKREKTTSSKPKENDKKSNHHCETRKENGVSHSREKQKDNDKKLNEHCEELKENTSTNDKENDKKSINDHCEEPKGNSSSNGNIPSLQEVNQTATDDSCNVAVAKQSAKDHLTNNKDKPKNLLDIPKKRIYDLLDENDKNMNKIEQIKDSSGPKKPKLCTENPVEVNEKPSFSEQSKVLIEDNQMQEKPEELKTVDLVMKDDGLQENTKKSSISELKEKNVTLGAPSKDDPNLTSVVDLSYESFTTSIKDSTVPEKTHDSQVVEKVDVLVSSELPTPVSSNEVKNIESGPKNIQLLQTDTLQNSPVCHNKTLSSSEPLQTNEIQDFNLKSKEDETKRDTEMMAPKILIQNENVPGIPSSEPIYVSSAFSSTSLGMQVLTTTIDTTVKEFAVQGSELPLLPNVNPTSTIGGNIVTTKEVSLSCDVTRPITVQSTPSCSTARIQEKTCLFTFNEDAETDNRANLNTTDLFDASLGLEDISPTKLPIGSNPSLDLISPSTSIAEISNSMNLVQTLGTSTINFINDVPDNSEIDIQQSSKQNSFSSNFVRGTRVTEIRCFVEKESTADHNYTLGDPLLGGNNEDKNILTTGLSLSNSPEEFQLNESHLEELSFNENNFIEENGTLEDLGLLLPCKKEKPDFDNIIDDTIPKPEDIQNSIKRLNMLVDISQGGQQKTISVDSTIDHTTNSDCSVSLGIDYAVNKLLFLGGGEVTSQNNSFSTIPDIENINIMESNVTSLHPKETLEDPINVKSRDESNSITSICTSYTNFIPTDSNHQKVVVEPVEQCTITSLDQLKKDYINDTCERVEKSKPVSKTSRETNVKSTPLYKQSKFATFLQSVKKDAIKNESVKVKDEMENYTIRRHNRTPVFPPKKKTVTQQHHTKSPPQSKKTEILSFDNNISFDSKSQAKSDTSRISETANECRIRVKTDLIKPTESKTHVSDLSQLDYITEDDQNIASEVVLPFRKPSPSEKVNLIETQEKKALEIISKTDVAVTKTTKHARFDKSGNDYIMENIINPHSDPKTRKNQVPEVKLAEKKGENSVDTNKKRKSTFSDNNDTSDSEKYIKRGDKRQKKSDDESDKIRGEHTKLHTKKPHDSSNNNKQKSQSSDEIFDKLVREGPVNKVFTQRISEQNTTAKSESSQINISSEVSKSRGHTTDNYRKDRISQSQSTAVSLHEAARYRDSVRHPYPDPEKRRDQRKPGYYQNYNAPPERRYADKRPSTVAVLDTSPKRFIRNSSHPYSSKSDPCSSRNHPYKSRDRRSSTEQLTNLLPNTNKSEGRTSHDENKFSWIDKFSDSGLFDTPSDLFMPPGTKREDPLPRK